MRRLPFQPLRWDGAVAIHSPKWHRNSTVCLRENVAFHGLNFEHFQEGQASAMAGARSFPQ